MFRLCHHLRSLESGGVLKRIALFGALLPLALVGCGSEEQPVTQQQAINEWNRVYKSDCYAPRDYGTSIYPTDLAMNPDFNCWMNKAIEVTDEGDDTYCFTKVWLASWKFSDDPGFGESDIQKSEVCYSFSWYEGDLGMYYVSDRDLGTFQAWPSGGY